MTAAPAGPAAPSWAIRPAVLADVERIAEITLAGWRFAYRGIVPDDRLAALDPAMFADARRELIAAPEPSAIVVAEDGAGVRGYVSVGPLRTPERDGHPALSTGALSSLYLDPPVIGTGAGGALHDAGVAHLAAAGFDRAILWIFAGNDRAATFYARRGWRVDSEPVQPEEWSAPAIRYARELP